MLRLSKLAWRMLGLDGVLREGSPVLHKHELMRIAASATEHVQPDQIVVAAGAPEVEVARLLRITECEPVGETA
jgi:hypothetical protein